MSNRYILVTDDQNIYYFNKEKLFSYLNEDGLDEDEKANYEVLEEFPLPNHYGLELDEEERPYGLYCPFNTSVWPENAVFILDQEDGSVFVPKKKAVTKTITNYEYSDPNPPTPTKRRATAKKAVKKSSKK